MVKEAYKHLSTFHPQYPGSVKTQKVVTLVAGGTVI